MNTHEESSMGKGQVSVGDDTPTGEPENGPKGPYITDEDDGTPRGKRPDGKRPLPSRAETEISRKSDLGSDRSGGRKA
jgi:hypothetical protein